MFIKINKKLIIKIKNLKIKPSNNYNKEALNLHKIVYLLTKFLPMFKKIEIDKIYIYNTLIINQIVLNKNNFFFKNVDFFAKGHFNIYKNYSTLYLDILRYKQFTAKNTTVFSYYTPKYVFMNLKTYFNNYPLYIVLKTENDNIHYSINTDKFSIRYKNFDFFIKNLFAKGKTNNTFNNYSADFKINKLQLKNDIYISADNVRGNIKNKIIFLKSKQANIKYPYYIEDLNLTKFYINYNLKTNSFISFSKKIKGKYKNYNFKANQIAFNYYLKNNNFFLSGKNLNINNDINLSTKEFLISKLPTLYFNFNNNNAVQKYFILNNKFIKGNKKLVTVSDIIGNILGFSIKISSIMADLINKEANSKRIVFNNIPFSNTKFIFNKKPYILTSSTNTLFNDNVKNILKKFQIDIPFTQIKGDNNLTFQVYITNQLKNIIYNFKSKNSYFNLKEMNFSYSNLCIKGDFNNSQISLQNFKFPYRYLNTDFDSNTTVNINDKFINSFTFIKKLDIDKYLNIRNFNEKIVMNLKNNFVYLLNSSIFINLNNKVIYLYSLKRLLKYSVFNEIFKDGNILIKLLDNALKIKADTVIKYPLILNQTEPDKINLEALITKNKIIIKNNNINTQITNFEKIDSHLNNLDINIESLIKIIDTVKNIINKVISTDKPSNKNKLKVLITADNTNFIYKNHKFLTNKADLTFDDEINFSATYKKSHLKGYTKNNYLLIEGKNYNKEALLPLLDFFNHFNNINLDFILVRSPQNFYTGKIYIKKGSVKDLGALNNIIAFINTIPALLTLHTPGFSSKGYKIKNGYINYLFYNNILYLKQIKIKGINLDFYGKGYINLNKNYIKMKIHTIVKIKLKKIPILGKALSYILFGKDGYLHVNIFIKGNLDNPEVLKDLGGGVIESPFKLFKRILTLPFNIF